MTITTNAREQRAAALAAAPDVGRALTDGLLDQRADITMAEGVVLGLINQGVRTFVVVLGHGTTDLGEVLRVYEEAGAIRSHAVRNEIEGAHAATALRWVTGQKAAVVTSIGPGALQALAASLVASSDGIGVWHIYADETTEAEGPNMQALPGDRQMQFLDMVSCAGAAYSLHTPQALPEAMRRGLNTVDHPHRPGPFFLLLPINTQPQVMEDFNLASLPTGTPPPLGAAADGGSYDAAARALMAADRVVVKVGGGARAAGTELAELLDLVDGFAVTAPHVSGTIPYEHPRNMTVGGSKGSISGNHAMENADVLLAIGTRGVCQSDMSRTGYPKVHTVVNINTDLAGAMHYNHTIPLVGDAASTLRVLIDRLRALGARPADLGSDWARECLAAWDAWQAHKQERYENPVLHDERQGADLLTEPAVIHRVTTWARRKGFVTFFDAGDVQANGFQIVEDERPGQVITETGASYMGFASSAVLATGLADEPFYAVALTGDGSFTMNPQILIDGVEHGARGCIVLLDNRRQGAISSLQIAQYGAEYATSDSVEVDYRAWAAAVRGVNALYGGHSLEELDEALAAAAAYDGLSLIHVPVYFGEDPLGGLGAFGRWNVGNWVEATQSMRHEIGL
jgi:3D-(3,5/4)-trihydroxycyclohexane-1,2-dione acylhydrolase (decyclizing)